MQPQPPSVASWNDFTFTNYDDLYKTVKTNKQLTDSFFWASHTFSHQVGAPIMEKIKFPAGSRGGRLLSSTPRDRQAHPADALFHWLAHRTA
jgi:hypothetical protein